MTKSENFYKLFKPDLTPKQMLAYGVFGGSYLGETINEYPNSWFVKAKISKTFNVNLNYFQVRAGLSLKEWKKKIGLWKRIPGVGFNGIAAILSEEEFLKLMRYKLIAGRHLDPDI